MDKNPLLAFFIVKTELEGGERQTLEKGMGQTMKKLIQFKNIVKEFDGQLVLKGINLDIYENEFVTLLGPSGCGKTTLLRILGGFLTPDEGQVLFDGEEISQLPPYKREINTVFQKYALFPHLNVYDMGNHLFCCCEAAFAAVR